MENSTYPTALTIAGSDSGGGAGIQADLKTFAALGVYGASAITAITAQNTIGVRSIHDLPASLVAAQIQAVLDDLPIRAIKIGMLSNADVVRIVAETLTAYPERHVVLDTVMLAKSGDALLHDDAVCALITHLLPLATLVTPNLPEAARLLNRDTIGDPVEAALALTQLGANAALVKGGHGNDAVVEDILCLDDGTVMTFRHPRIATTHTHGTGCSLSSAIAARLAAGVSLPDARAQAIQWLHGAIRHSWPLGAGHGPVHHFWNVWSLMSPLERLTSDHS